MVGKYPHYLYEIEVSPHLIWYEQNVGTINYKDFVNQRIKLKIRQRKESGLPTNFLGKQEGFTFGDIAVFKNNDSLEKWKQMIKSNKRVLTKTK